MASNNRISKVAIVGATGRIGTHVVKALLATGKHTITAISRHGSSATPPPGVALARVDYSDEAALTAALKGHDYLIISLVSSADPAIHVALCNAAAAAGVQWVMPNAWGMDLLNERFMAESVYAPFARKAVDDAKAAGLKYTVLACSFWYEMSLAMGVDFFGVDAKARKAVLFDEGTQKVNTSTMVQCGRAVAALLSLPVKKEGDGPALEDWEDKPLYISSWLVSQRDMLDSVQRARGDSDAEWEISHEGAKERTEKALGELKQGNFGAFPIALYTRFFYKDGEKEYKEKGDGNYEAVWGTANKALGLPEEDLDEVTKGVVEMVLKGEGSAY